MAWPASSGSSLLSLEVCRRVTHPPSRVQFPVALAVRVLHVVGTGFTSQVWLFQGEAEAAVFFCSARVALCTRLCICSGFLVISRFLCIVTLHVSIYGLYLYTL
jgi:hypothetical protein